jgi:hypothetical protein
MSAPATAQPMPIPAVAAAGSPFELELWADVAWVIGSLLLDDTDRKAEELELKPMPSPGKTEEAMASEVGEMEGKSRVAVNRICCKVIVVVIAVTFDATSTVRIVRLLEVPLGTARIVVTSIAIMKAVDG